MLWTDLKKWTKEINVVLIYGGKGTCKKLQSKNHKYLEFFTQIFSQVSLCSCFILKTLKLEMRFMWKKPRGTLIMDPYLKNSP